MCVVGATLIVVLGPSTVTALPIDGAVTAIGDRLVAGQGPDGTWPGEADFTGSIVAGLVNAYKITGKTAYKTAAQLGGNYIINSSDGNYFGDEAYALALLSEVTADPPYANAAREFYNGLDTHAYIGGFEYTDRSNAVFYVAQHTVAAHKVGAADAAIWREGLIQYLARVGDDAAYYPVMSLGVATWALVQTGAMDDTRIDPLGLIGEDYWTDVTLSDLSDILLSHQVTSNGYPGPFYHRFDHNPVGPGFEASGYTEDTVFGLLGLIAADKLPSFNFKAEVLAGRLALAAGVASNGDVYEHIWIGGASYNAYGGEVLQAIPEPASLLLLGAGALLLRRRRRSLG